LLSKDRGFKPKDGNKKWTTELSSVVQKEWNRSISRKISFYNLDAIISVWYRINSKKATQFRKWSTKVLKQHITRGFTLNKQRLGLNYVKFLQAVDDVKNLLPEGSIVNSKDVLELVKSFANTWFNLESYDEDKLPTQGFTKKDLQIVLSGF